VDGEAYEQDLSVLRDPRLSDVTDADLRAQFDLARKISDRTSAANEAVIRIRSLKAQIADRLQETSTPDLKKAAGALAGKLSEIESAIYQVRNQSPKDPLNFSIRLNNRVAALQEVVEEGDARPTDQAYEIFRMLSAELEGHLSRLDRVVATEGATFNGALVKERLAPIVVR
jgi:hypothetical protein